MDKTIKTFLAKRAPYQRNFDVLTSINYFNQRGFRMVCMLGWGSFGAVILAE